MAWIPAYQALGQHPKARRLARELGVSRAEAIGHLLLLWWWALDYAPTGCLERYTDMDLADAAEWPGDAERFGAALRDAGFVDETGLHDWKEYGGRYLQQQQAARERKASWRQRQAQQRPLALPPAATTSPKPVEQQATPATAAQQQAVRKERGTRWPADFEVAEEMTKWALAKGLTPEEISDQTYRLRDWALANGAIKVDWVATWRGWMGRYIETRGRRAA